MLTARKVKGWLRPHRELLFLLLLLAALYACAQITYHFSGSYLQEAEALRRIEKITRILMYGK